MSTSRRSASGRGPGASSQGSRRPRVAGLRSRSAQDAKDQNTPEQERTTASEDAAPEATDSETAASDAAASEPVDVGERSAPTDPAESGAAESDDAESDAAEDDEGSPGDAADSDSAEDSAEHDSGEPDEPESDSGDSDAGEARGGGRFAALTRRPVALIVAMLVLTAGFGGLAYWFHSEAYSLRNEGPGANRALVDQAATSQVKGQVTDAVEKVFSYDFANTAKTKKAADQLLTGDAVQKYEKMFATVRKQAPKQKLVLTTTVRAAGVTQLQGDRAEVLLFVDQNMTRTDNGQSSVGPAQMTVSAEKHGDKWKISGIKPH